MLPKALRIRSTKCRGLSKRPSEIAKIDSGIDSRIDSDWLLPHLILGWFQMREKKRIEDTAQATADKIRYRIGS